AAGPLTWVPGGCAGVGYRFSAPAQECDAVVLLAVCLLWHLHTVGLRRPVRSALFARWAIPQGGRTAAAFCLSAGLPGAALPQGYLRLLRAYVGAVYFLGVRTGHTHHLQ